MKILTISNYYPPHFVGGYEILCRDTMQYLKDKGHEVHVLTSDYQASHSQKNITRKLKLIDYDTPTYFNKLYTEHINYKQVYQKIQTFKPDIVFFWSLRGISLSVIEAVEELGVSKVFQIGDFWMKGFIREGWNFQLKQHIKSFLPLMHAKPIKIEPSICVSRWIAKEMYNRYKVTDSKVIPPFTFIPETLIEKVNPSVSFVFSGRIEPEKGLDLAINALIQFYKNNPDAEFSFHIYGDGNKAYINSCKKIAEEISSHIIWEGKVDNRSQIYTKHDVLLMPTRMKEPFGMVITEAMAHGTVVVATNAYGPSETIQDQSTGLLFPCDDINAMADCISKLYFSKDLREQLRKSAFEQVKRLYNCEKINGAIETFLKQRRVS